MGSNSDDTKKFKAGLEGVKTNFQRFPFERTNITIALKSSAIDSMLSTDETLSAKGLRILSVQDDSKINTQKIKSLSIALAQANNARFIKMMVPLLTVLTISIAGLLISPKNYEPRLGLPATAILALVFLQDRYSDIVPSSLEYSTPMDKLYIIAYAVIISIFMETVSTGNKWLHCRSRQTGVTANKLLDSGRIYAIFILYLLAGIGIFI